MRLNVEALLNYMVGSDDILCTFPYTYVIDIQAIRVIGSSKNDVYINMKSPAQVKYEL